MDVTQVAAMLIALLGAIVTSVLIPLAKNKLSEHAFDNTCSWVEILVKAAEKQFGADEGLAKFNFVQQELAKKGIKVDATDLQNMVNSVLADLENVFGNPHAVGTHVEPAAE